MTPTSRLLLVSSAALSLASCSWFNHGGQGDYDTQPGSGGYDTSSNQYGVPGGGGGAPSTPPSNPTYSQAAYEDSGVTSAADTPSAPAASASAPSAPAHSTPPPSAPVSRPSGSGTVHTVVKGDTLWGIGKKYGVSVDSIKKANGLTKDTVVLGAKLQIPAKN